MLNLMYRLCSVLLLVCAEADPSWVWGSAGVYRLDSLWTSNLSSQYRGWGHRKRGNDSRHRKYFSCHTMCAHLFSQSTEYVIYTNCIHMLTISHQTLVSLYHCCPAVANKYFPIAVDLPAHLMYLSITLFLSLRTKLHHLFIFSFLRPVLYMSRRRHSF